MLCGDMRLAATQPAEAIPYYERAAELTPAYAQPFYNLGTVYRWLGDEAKAATFTELADQKREEWEQVLLER